MEKTLAAFFAEAGTICGAEKTFHALFCHNLIAHGMDHRRIAREFRLGKAPVDVVVFDAEPKHGGKPQVAIEFKGGAYGNRNALHDTIDKTGFCRDLDKLKPFADAGIESWFICIDLAELGVALSEPDQRRVAEQARQRGIKFVYFCQGKGEFLLGGPSGIIHQAIGVSAVTDDKPHHLGFGAGAPWIDRFKSLCQGMEASEDTYTGLFYNALRNEGYGARQVSKETYFNCASVNGSRMQLRPDLAVFAPGVEGRFNLYRHGDRRQPNDAHKLSHLLAMVEVKASGAKTRPSDTRFAAEIASDIDKLGSWRQMLSASGCGNRASEAAYIMIAVDQRPNGLAPQHRATLVNRAKALNVDLIYVEV